MLGSMVEKPRLSLHSKGVLINPEQYPDPATASIVSSLPPDLEFAKPVSKSAMFHARPSRIFAFRERLQDREYQPFSTQIVSKNRRKFLAPQL
jgi:hypothetical protein